MNLQVLLLKQGLLDKSIRKRSGNVPVIEEKMELALLVELAELANEVQSFKYWKLNKKVDESKMKEEWADCLHFALMIERKRKQVRFTMDPLLWFDEIPTSLIDDAEAMTEAFRQAERIAPMSSAIASERTGELMEGFVETAPGSASADAI